ncbi:AMP-binding protein [Leifsonia poae]|uniref:AMP-binding protein n=1 Tax=Leifsonia poae TaxID=110933 RepID=UPI001CC080D6|nr:AMP-binding protein [Leifsonia poae]
MTLLTHAELTERVARASTALGSAAGPALRGRIVPVNTADPTDAIATVLALRTVGALPLATDDRWSAGQHDAVRRLAEAGAHPGQAWATLTSGSTGAPRVVLRTDESWTASHAPVAELLGLTPDDALFLPAPAASSLTLFSLAHAFAAGASLVLPRGHTVVADDLADATLVHGTPRSLRSIVDAIESGAPHRMRAALVGGAHLDAGLRSRAEGLGLRVIAYYGAAELSFVAVDVDGRGLRAFPGVLLETRGNELWVRSPFVASCYADGTGPLRRDGSGWATVGDRALLRDDRLELRGRGDDAILTAAATVVPEDVETALRAIDGVADAVVFGLPHPGIGALVAAVVEPDGTHPLPAAAVLRARAAETLLPAQLPRRWFAVDALPRTVSGKPARAEIVRRALAGEVSRHDR